MLVFGNKKGKDMIANTLSACIATEKVEESRDFYRQTHCQPVWRSRAGRNQR